MKRCFLVILTFMMPTLLFLSCGGDEDSEATEIPVEHTTTHMKDIESLSWQKVSVVNDRYLVINSYVTDDEFLMQKTAGIVLYTNPKVNFEKPEGTYTITSALFTATDCGYSWFELTSEKGQENCGTVSISSTSVGHKVEVKISRMVDEKGDLAKGLFFSYEGQLTKSNMLEY